MSKPTVTVTMGEEGDRAIHLDEPDGFLRIKVSETGSAGHKRALYHAIEHIAELEVERDQLREKVSTWKGEANDWELLAYRYQEERDALAAHVDDIRAAWSKPAELYVHTVDRIFHALERGPQTSLAQRDARMKAEVLEELIRRTTRFKEADPVRGLAGSMADEYHQKTERVE